MSVTNTASTDADILDTIKVLLANEKDYCQHQNYLKEQSVLLETSTTAGEMLNRS